MLIIKKLQKKKAVLQIKQRKKKTVLVEKVFTKIS